MVIYKDGEEEQSLVKCNLSMIKAAVESLGALPAMKRRRNKDNDSIGSGSSRTKRSKESILEVDKAVCDMSPTFVGKMLGLNIRKLLRREKRHFTGLFTPRSDDLTSLYEEVYKLLLYDIGSSEYPDDLAPEPQRSTFVGCLLKAVVMHIKREFKLQTDQLGYYTKQNIEFEFAGRLRTMQPDFVIRGYRKGQDPDDDQLFFTVAECKTGNCGLAVKQALVYMKAAYSANGSRGRVYGLASTGVFCKLLKYEPKSDSSDPAADFEIVESVRFLFAEMIDDKYKADWMANCTKIIQVLYCILYNELALDEK